jgi:hypothetical protein
MLTKKQKEIRVYVRDTSAIVVDVAPFRPQIKGSVVKEVLTESVCC